MFRRSLTRSSKPCLGAMPSETNMPEKWTSSEKNLREYRWRFPFQICFTLSTQGAAGKYQIAQEKTQLELDKAHQEIDILREKMDRNTGESRRVSYQRRRSTSLWFWISKDGHRWSWMIIGDHMMDQSKTLSWPNDYTFLAFFSPSFIVVILLHSVFIEWA